MANTGYNSDDEVYRTASAVDAADGIVYDSDGNQILPDTERRGKVCHANICAHQCCGPVKHVPLHERPHLQLSRQLGTRRCSRWRRWITMTSPILSSPKTFMNRHQQSAV